MILIGKVWKCRTEILTRGSKATFHDEYDENFGLEKVINSLIDGTTFGDIKRIEVIQKEANNGT